MAREKREIVYHEECISLAFCAAIALQSIHLFLESPSESLQYLFIAHPTPACMYI